MNQPDLFSVAPERPVEDVHGLARTTDPITSRMAARTITGRTENEILALFVEHGPMTADEVCERYPKYPPTIKTALSRLVGHELIEDSGILRPSGRGRASIVWALKDPARDGMPPCRAGKPGGSPLPGLPPGELA